LALRDALCAMVDALCAMRIMLTVPDSIAFQPSTGTNGG